MRACTVVAHSMELDELLFSSFFMDHGNNNEAKNLSSNLDSSKIKSKSFTATVDDYSQIAIRVPNKTILFAVTDTYMLVPQNTSGDFRVFGPLAYKKLDSAPKGTVITGIAYYI